MRIAVAGAGYVGLSLAVLLAQHNDVTLVDVVKRKVDLVNASCASRPRPTARRPTGTPSW